MDRIDELQMMAEDPETGLPALTSLMYRICDGNGAKFDEACRLVRIFMEKPWRINNESDLQA